MTLLLSVTTNDWRGLHTWMAEARKSEKEAAAKGELGPLAEYPQGFYRAEGTLVLYDWEKERCLAHKLLPMPLSFAIYGEGKKKEMAVSCWRDFLRLKDGKDPVAVTNSLFNHLHSVQPIFKDGSASPTSYLVTSSGTDLLAEIDRDGKILWSWFAFENGYDQTPHGVKLGFDKTLYWPNKCTVTARQSTHVNSAILLEDGNIIACLPAVGQIILINRRTGHQRVLMEGLAFPHSIRRAGEHHFTICNTRGRQVILIDDDYREVGRVPVDAEWIQDAFVAPGPSDPSSSSPPFPLTGRLYAVSNIDVYRRINTSDDLHTKASALDVNRVIEMSVDFRAGTSIVEKSLHLPVNFRLYEAAFISKEDAEWLQKAWRPTADAGERKQEAGEGEQEQEGELKTNGGKVAAPWCPETLAKQMEEYVAVPVTETVPPVFAFEKAPADNKLLRLSDVAPEPAPFPKA